MSYFNIPARPINCLSGSAFIQKLKSSGVGTALTRDTLIEEQISIGNIPNFMRIISKVIINILDMKVELFVLPDYLCVGDNSDYVYVPLNPMTAQRICNRFNASLPTRKLVNVIWNQVINKLSPQTMGPPKYQYDHTMMTTERFEIHSEWCVNQFIEKTMTLGLLTGGHKKDVIICQSIQDPAKEKVAIYGWHSLDGVPIQSGIQDKAHEITYRDYSHSIRLVSKDLLINGQQHNLIDVLKDENLSKLISDEKPTQFKNPRYVTSNLV